MFYSDAMYEISSYCYHCLFKRKINKLKVWSCTADKSGPEKWHFINITSNETPGELSLERMISSCVKITCYLHMRKDVNRGYGYQMNQAFALKNISFVCFIFTGEVFFNTQREISYPCRGLYYPLFTVPKFAISQSEANSTVHVLISYDIKSLTWFCYRNAKFWAEFGYGKYLIVPFWYASAAYQARLISPWVLYEPWLDQTHLMCCPSVPKRYDKVYLSYMFNTVT